MPLIAPAPAWVSVAPMPSPQQKRMNAIQGGLYTLIFDTQFRLEGDHYTIYQRIAQLVTNQSGLETAPRLDYQFDPSESDFVVHDVRVWRDGKAASRLPLTKSWWHARSNQLEAGVTEGLPHRLRRSR